MTTRFRMRGRASDTVTHIQNACQIPLFMAQTLVNRGVTTPEEADAYLNPSLEHDWHNPYDMPNMQAIVERLQAAITAGQHIVVYGDFDLDGISATTVLTRGIRALGGKATPFIPNRTEEGYGITQSAIERLLPLQPDLLITVDCGIACKDEVASLQQLGISVLVTDHHEAGDAVPENVPVCDPKIVPDHPSSALAGVGVALKVVQALGGASGYPHLWHSYADFATLGTVADLMPFNAENRALVAKGLQRLNENPRPCLQALKERVCPDGKELSSLNLSFTLIPRLNAAGRMGNAEVALQLLLSDNYEESCALAEELDHINDARRSIEACIAEEAQEIAQHEYHGERSVVIAGHDWHEGVKGIVASRLVNLYHVPSILFTIIGDEARGSGRSCGSVNLFQEVEKLSPLLTRFGGHGAAVGITLPVRNLPAFKEQLEAQLQQLPADQFDDMLDIDAVVDIPSLTLQNVEQLDRLAPFGQEAPAPRFLLRNVSLINARAVGANKNHLSFQISDGRADLAAIMFNCEDIEEVMASDRLVDVAFTLQVDDWRGKKTVKAMVDAIVPAKKCSALYDMFDPHITRFVEDLFDASEAHNFAYTHSYSDKHEHVFGRRLEERKKWERIAADNPDELERALVAAIIGTGTPHETQQAILNQLKQGSSTLGVMATGRGKSLIFQVYAAFLALTAHKPSLFVYPLRALMSDQAFHIEHQFSQFGLVCKVLNGACTSEQREDIYAALAAGEIDIIMTTPEFLSFHADRLAEATQFGFMVVDEAHHIGQAKAGQRLSYAQLGSVATQLSIPVVLALTATAPQKIADEIAQLLSIHERVIDNASRDNLSIDNQRNVRNKDDYLAHIVAGGGKTVVYVNSREQSVNVARRLRRRIPQLALQIGFYNAALSREERTRVEDLFRSGQLQVLVSTSAFGEGIDIPDIRHVALYHMPFSEVEFNQMSGRAGRDGKPSLVHLLYGASDVAINEGILSQATPSREVMAHIYRCMRSLQDKQDDGPVSLTAEELAYATSNRQFTVMPQAALCSLSVFSELGLIDCTRSFKQDKEVFEFSICANAPKVELVQSVRYVEGLDEIEDFKAFKEWAMMCSTEELVARITHPITPHFEG